MTRQISPRYFGHAAVLCFTASAIFALAAAAMMIAMKAGVYRPSDLVLSTFHNVPPVLLIIAGVLALTSIPYRTPLLMLGITVLAWLAAPLLAALSLNTPPGFTLWLKVAYGSAILLSALLWLRRGEHRGPNPAT